MRKDIEAAIVRRLHKFTWMLSLWRGLSQEAKDRITNILACNFNIDDWQSDRGRCVVIECHQSIVHRIQVEKFRSAQAGVVSDVTKN